MLTMQHFEVTPAIGREFKGDIQLDEIMNAPNKDELIKDLAYMSEPSFRSSRLSTYM